MKNNIINFNTIDEFCISGVHTITQSDSLVLWLHGITTNKNEYLDLFKDGADYMGRHNISSLRFDFRGHGESSGSSLDFSITAQLMDIDAAIKYLINFNERIKIHIVGCSFGAPPGIFSFLNYKDIIKSITLIAPVLSYEKTFLNPETEWAKSIFNNASISGLYDTGKLYFDDYFFIGMRLYKEMQLINPESFLKDIPIKINIIHGNCDSMVPFYISEEVAEKNKNVNLICFDNMDHGYNDVNDESGLEVKSIENKKEIFNLIKTFVEDGQK